MSLIHRIFGHSDAILCPRCEKPLEGHDDGACAQILAPFLLWIDGRSRGCGGDAKTVLDGYL